MPPGPVPGPAPRPASEPAPDGRSSWRGRGAAVVLATGVVLGGVLVLLWPVLAAPVNADDRYWYLQAGPRSGGTWYGLLVYGWQELPTAAASGRLAPLSSASRRLAQLAVMEVGVATGTPVVVLQGVVKLLTLGLVVSVLVAFLAALRSRGPDGSLHALPRRHLAWVALAGTALAAAGSQAQAQFRNGWTSYAVLTWGSLVVVVGVLALLLVLLRLVAARPRAATVPVVVLLVLVAAFLNLSYELVLVTAPAALLVVLLQPVGAPGGRRAALRARAVVGGSFLGAFTVLFVGIRVWLSGLCEGAACYAGTQPQLGAAAVRTMLLNLVGAAPVGRAGELELDLERAGLPTAVPGAAAWSVLLGLAVGAGLLVAWWAWVVRPAGGAAGTRPGPGGEPVPGRVHARTLVVGATVLAVVGVGEAVLMGLSVQAAELIGSLGRPYRHTMITWTTASFALALLAVACLVLLGPRRARGAGSVGAVVVAVAVAVLAAAVTPANVAATRATRLQGSVLATEQVHTEVVLGDVGATADARRCEVLGRLLDGGGDRAAVATAEWADRSFRYYHDRPFCTAGPP
ncbi:hypothetical protein [Aquipuribacter sp. SD81]|uniref:hypothetical protein n=1 Tax=Aquipuribacter sp. SD81 TaxID=3127703 RepID=UPI003016CF87